MTDTQRHATGSGPSSWFDQYGHIVRGEIAAIESRRAASRAKTPPENVGPVIGETDVARDKLLGVVGLSLSGGGIRSAAVGLGVLQALNHHRVLPRIDYLSTVSGGGYIGSSLSAAMAKGADFPFGVLTADQLGQPPANEISDTAAVGHLRNYSNYLIPNGFRDLLTASAIIVRGLVANLSLILPIVLLLAAITIASNPARSCLYAANLFGFDLESGHSVMRGGFIAIGAMIGVIVFLGVWSYYRFMLKRHGASARVVAAYGGGVCLAVGLITECERVFELHHFVMTLTACLLGIVGFFAWALWRSGLPPKGLPEFQSHLPTVGATYLVIVAVIGFFEFQPFMLAEMFDTAEAGVTSGNLIAGVATSWIKTLATAAAPVAAVVTVFRQQFTDLLKGDTSSSLRAQILALLAKLAIWIAGAALPLLIWVGYLYLSYWGILNNKAVASLTCPNPDLQWSTPAAAQTPAADMGPLAGKFRINDATKNLTVEFDAKSATTVSRVVHTLTAISHAPVWLVEVAQKLSPAVPETVSAWVKAHRGGAHWSIIGLYLVAGLLLSGISWFLAPNANSLHRLYRDRLSKAFLFALAPAQKPAPAAPTPVAGDPPVAGGAVRRVSTASIPRDEPSVDQGRDFEPNDALRLSDLYSPETQPVLRSPYHLINAALNIQGSDYANRRGRNADFFLFSPLYVGSEATRYCGTAHFEHVAPGLDLATAMAISGAAASSNMGSASIRPLTPTLALLNVRLGYWLKNPRYAAQCKRSDRYNHLLHHRRSDPTPLYLWSEISGRLYENSNEVYLTDGGHIENLGIYELLRRRCAVIIAVDAEADAEMNFPALMTLQRYARIDLGIRIDLPWTPIRAATRDWMADNAGAPPNEPPSLSRGPHVAIGTIDYGGDQIGHLVYIKSSLSGDENDYVRDYARRYARFPHETTGDQFFSEEQFEVYRALGFHMVQGWLQNCDDVVVNTKEKRCALATFDRPGIDAFDKVRTALGLPKIEPKVAAPPTSGA